MHYHYASWRGPGCYCRLGNFLVSGARELSLGERGRTTNGPTLLCLDWWLGELPGPSRCVAKLYVDLVQEKSWCLVLGYRIWWSFLNYYRDRTTERRWWNLLKLGSTNGGAKKRNENLTSHKRIFKHQQLVPCQASMHRIRKNIFGKLAFYSAQDLRKKCKTLRPERALASSAS